MIQWGGQEEVDRLRVVLLLAVLTLTVLALFATDKGEPAMDQYPPSTCMEDDPCWDCETMGNQVCGPRP